MTVYDVSINTKMRIHAENEDELHEMALELLAQMITNRQIDFVIDNEWEDE